MSPRLLPEATARELYDADDATREANAEQAWLDRMRQARENGPRVNVDQGIYTVSTKAAMLDFDLLTTDRRTGETHAELTVYLTDAVNLGKLLHRGRLNLLSGERRERLARYLAGRTKELGIDWPDLLEEAVSAVVGLYRAGEPAILLRDAPEPPGAGEPLVAPILAADGSTVIFGDGGSLKSYLALALAASLHSGQPLIGGMPPNVTRRVGFLDWEWSPHVHKRRLARLCGDELPDLVYVGCRLPIREERDRLRRVIRDHKLEYLVVDSVGLAAGGEPESAEVAVQFFASLRELGLDALLVAHVTKQDAKGSAERPFGSAFWHNSARSTWYVKARPTTGGMSAGLYHKKSNDGPLSGAFTIDVDFSDDRTRMARGDIHAVPDLAAILPVRVRMIEALRGGSLTLVEIADAIGAEVEAVRIAGKRDQEKPENKRQLVTFAGPDGVYRWGSPVMDERTNTPTNTFPTGEPPTGTNTRSSDGARKGRFEHESGRSTPVGNTYQRSLTGSPTTHRAFMARVVGPWRPLTRPPRRLWVSCSCCRSSTLNEDRHLRGWQESTNTPRLYLCADCSEPGNRPASRNR